MAGDVLIGPATWPGAPLAIQPGDLASTATHGYGFGAPLVMQPWDGLADLVERGNYYGTEPPRTGDVFADAPRTNPSGGTLYFTRDIEPSDLEVALTVMNVALGDREYAVFDAAATDPVRSRYLAQRRIVPARALAAVFGITKADLAKGPATQTIDTRGAIFSFVAGERIRWGSSTSEALQGTLGGDGDWARESLAFGFTVENAEHGIVRVWSRPWLVTK
jgi:hypothetical protein